MISIDKPGVHGGADTLAEIGLREGYITEPQGRKKDTVTV